MVSYYNVCYDTRQNDTLHEETQINNNHMQTQTQNKQMGKDYLYYYINIQIASVEGGL